MSRHVLPLLLAATLGGCGSRVMVHMREAAVPSGPDYVVVKIKASKDVVFDCVSMVDGVRDPTCTRVKYRGPTNGEEGK